MGFYHIWSWPPSWSCDLDALYTHWLPLSIDDSYKPKLTLIGQAVSEEKRFEYYGTIHVYCSGVGVEQMNPWGPVFFQNH